MEGKKGGRGTYGGCADGFEESGRVVLDVVVFRSLVADARLGGRVGRFVGAPGEGDEEADEDEEEDDAESDGDRDEDHDPHGEVICISTMSLA